MRLWRALPTMLQVAFAEAMEYRAEMLVWVLATTMPFVSLALWAAVAEAAPVQGAHAAWGQGRFVAYFLSVFVVRQLLSAWAAWQINFEVRQGVLAMKLLRPVHPVVGYLVENLVYLPQRIIITLPVILFLALGPPRAHLAADPWAWVVLAPALVGGFLVAFFANVLIGSMAMFMESSLKLMDLWLAGYFVFSGYLFPLDLFPPWLATAAGFLPFGGMVSLPVDLMTGALTAAEALPKLAVQWTWAVAFFLLTFLSWRQGIRRFQAYGG